MPPRRFKSNYFQFTRIFSFLFIQLNLDMMLMRGNFFPLPYRHKDAFEGKKASIFIINNIITFTYLFSFKDFAIECDLKW